MYNNLMAFYSNESLSTFELLMGIDQVSFVIFHRNIIMIIVRLVLAFLIGAQLGQQCLLLFNYPQMLYVRNMSTIVQGCLIFD